jgi:SAM-dependent methyltransferase
MSKQLTKRPKEPGVQHGDNTTLIHRPPIWKAAVRRIPGVLSVHRGYFSIRQNLGQQYQFLSRIAREKYGRREPLFDAYQDDYSHDRAPEQERYKLILDAMRSRRTHWGNAIEIGCSKGLFTVHLAMLCDSVLACDISPRACALTLDRCAHLDNVTVKRLDVQRDSIVGEYDVVCIMDTLAYVHGRRRLQRAIGQLVRAVRCGGILVFSEVCFPEYIQKALWQRWMPEGAEQHLAIIGKRSDLCLIYSQVHRSQGDYAYIDHLLAILEKAQPKLAWVSTAGSACPGSPF